MINNDYNEITNEEMYIDPQSRTIYEKDELHITAFDVIKATAEKLGQVVNDPNPNCKHCQGRGYVGRDASSKAPIPCQCIYTPEAKEKAADIYKKTRKLSRSEKRKHERLYRKMIKKGGTR